MAEKHDRYEKIFRLVLSVFIGIAALSDFTTAAYCGQTFEIRIGTGIILAFVFVLQQKYADASYKFSSKEQKNTAVSWGKFIHTIKKELSLESSERQRARDFYDWISSSYDTLIEIAPMIDSSVFKEYNKKYDDKNLVKAVTQGNNETTLNIDKTIAEPVEEDKKTNTLIKMKSEAIIDKSKPKNKPKSNYKKIITAYENFDPARMRYEMDRHFADNVS